MGPGWDLFWQCVTLFGLSFACGLIPVKCGSRLSPANFRFFSTLGIGLLIGTALIVIIPEGMHSIYGGGHDHDHAATTVTATAGAGSRSGGSGSGLGLVTGVVSGSAMADKPAASVADGTDLASELRANGFRVVPNPNTTPPSSANAHARLHASDASHSHAHAHAHAHGNDDGHDHSSVASISRASDSSEVLAKARFARRSDPSSSAASAGGGSSAGGGGGAGGVPDTPMQRKLQKDHGAPVSVTRTRIGGGPVSADRRLLQLVSDNNANAKAGAVDHEHDHDHNDHSHSHAPSPAGSAGGSADSAHDHAHDHGTESGTKDGRWAQRYIGVTLASGFLFMILFDRVLSSCGGGHAHSHGHSHSHGGGHGDDHSHAPAIELVEQGRSPNSAAASAIDPNGSGGSNGSPSSGGSGGGSSSAGNAVLIGLILHCAVDGFAMGIVTVAEQQSLSQVVFVAILMHKLPSAFGLAFHLMTVGVPSNTVLKQLAMFCASIPGTAFLTYITAPVWLSVFGATANDSGLMGLLLLFSGGTFLSTVALHVLPELGRDDERTGDAAAAAAKGVNWSTLIALTIGTFIPVLLHVEHSH